MKVLLSGYYGFGNLGDEAVLQALTQGLREKDQNTEITVLPSKRTGWLKIISEIIRADVLISGGGSLFQNVTSKRSFLYYIGIVLLAKLFRRKTVIFSQGFGPLSGGFYRALARFALNSADLITLRDKNSFEEVKKLGVTNPAVYVTADPSFILPVPEKEQGRRILSIEGVKIKDQPIVGIVVRNALQSRDLYENLAKVCDWLSKNYHYLPVFVLFHSPDDMEATSRVMALMEANAHVIFRTCKVDEMLSIFSQFDLLIGMRLHALIFAAMNAVPMLGISYDPKVSAFMQEIGQPYINIKENISFEDLKTKLEEILANKNRIKEELAQKRQGLRGQAGLNFELFFNPPPLNPPLHPERTCPEFYRGSRGRWREGEVLDFSGIKVDNLSLDEAAARVGDFLTSEGAHLIVTPNPEIIVACQKDLELREIINRANLRTPDGISMVVVSKLLGNPLKERVSGIDLMQRIIEIYGKQGKKIFLLGGGPGVAEEAAANLIKRYPGINIVGLHYGYFGDDSNVIQMIKNTRPDILFVGLGAGRQERWINRHLRELNVPVSMVIGGSLDVLSGRKKRAPKWIRNLYIEWLYRLFTEPSRWKRQLALPRFLRLMFKIGV